MGQAPPAPSPGVPEGLGSNGRAGPGQGTVVADRGLREGILHGLMGRAGLRSAEADLRTAQAGSGGGSGNGSGARPRGS